MKFLKQLFNFYINSSIHVAIAVYSLAWITLLEFGISYDELVLYFIFYASISGYNFVKYFGMAKFYHRSLADWLKAIQLFSLCCFMLMVYYAFQLKTMAVCGILVFGMITFFYAMPFFPKRRALNNQLSLRDVGGIKVYLIALVWSGVTVVLPLINNDYLLDLHAILASFQRFIFIILLMLPFEIRDLRYDSLKLATIPQKIGIKGTKIVGVLLAFLFIFIEFLKLKPMPTKMLIPLIIITITMLSVLYSKKQQGKYYCSFFVEGLPILWLILTILIG